MGDLETTVSELAARVAALETENARLRNQAPQPEPTLSRREMLRAGTLAGAVAAGAIVMRPATAHASVSALELDTANDGLGAETSLTSSASTATLWIANTDTGDGVLGTATGGNGSGVHGQGSGGIAGVRATQGYSNGHALLVDGLNNGNSDDVVSISGPGAGRMVNVVATNATNASNAVEVTHGGTASAIVGVQSNALAGECGVVGKTQGTGAGVAGLTYGGGDAMTAVATGTGNGISAQINNSANTRSAVSASTNGTGAAISAETTNATNIEDTIVAQHDGLGRAVYAVVTNGDSSAAAVYAQHEGLGPAIVANMTNPDSMAPLISALHVGQHFGNALLAGIESETNASDAVAVYTIGTGNALGVGITNMQSHGAGIHVDTEALGAGIHVTSQNSGTTAPGVFAHCKGTGTGIEGQSDKGLGGRFTGKTAQVQLVPSNAASHPASGAAGQLFVDSTNRLWFCKGGTNWRQLA